VVAAGLGSEFMLLTEIPLVEVDTFLFIIESLTNERRCGIDDNSGSIIDGECCSLLVAGIIVFGAVLEGDLDELLIGRKDPDPIVEA